MRWNCVYVDQERRFSLEVELDSGKTFVAIPVRNQTVEYLEWYEVDEATFWDYRVDPSLAHEFVERCKRRELDHLLLFQPGSDRGVAG